MSENWRVAVIDSGFEAEPALPRAAARRFIDTGAAVLAVPTLADSDGHGSRVANIVRSGAPSDLLLAEVFGDGRPATAATVAAAVLWALDERATLIHMSLGLRHDRAVLAAAVAAAVAAGTVIVAATPARGAPTFPARYASVLRATGDARCGEEEIAALNASRALFGACPRLASHPRAGGASIGAAHLTRFIVKHIDPGVGAAAVQDRLQSLARYDGAERRSAALR